MKYVENVVIGKPLVSVEELFALNKEDYINNEKEKTYFTEERYLPRILVNIGIYPSTSEVRKNKPNLNITLDKIDFIEIKVSKKRKLYITIGE